MWRAVSCDSKNFKIHIYRSNCVQFYVLLISHISKNFAPQFRHLDIVRLSIANSFPVV